MSNLYFCEADNQSKGILRAVLSWTDCERLLVDQPATPLGEEFPKGPAEPESSTSVPILYILPEEATARWPTGFYRLHADSAEIHARVQTLAHR